MWEDGAPRLSAEAVRTEKGRNGRDESNGVEVKIISPLPDLKGLENPRWFQYGYLPL
jgi:hypothetical protein